MILTLKECVKSFLIAYYLLLVFLQIIFQD